ncbi:MAG: hypothetical protein H0U85_05795 [Gemmatimonadales bacterium]|nr:hypothetical protein [Gemmatimonadales bacterium]
MIRLAALLCVAAATACSPSGDPSRVRAALDRRAAEVAARAASADSAARAGRRSDQPIAQWVLPARYAEISGIALTEDGRLLAHGDERAEIWEIDFRRGVVTKAFGLGQPPVQGDFEAMTMADGKLYLLDSDGRIYESTEGKDNETVAYNEYDTRLTKECEFEGLTFDPVSRSLVLACKHVRREAPPNALVLYRWPLPGTDSERAAPVPIVIPIARFNELGQTWKKFEASDIARDPRTGTFIVISSLQQAMAEITLDGRVLHAGRIPGRHLMPEGVAVTVDGRLIISDEANGQRPVLTVYPSPFP